MTSVSASSSSHHLCRSCKKLKPVSSFHRRNAANGVRVQYWCKECQASRLRAYSATPAGRAVRTSLRLKRLYGITLEQRSQMEEALNGRCEVCGIKAEKLVVDHDHVSSRIRGLLCHQCNIALGNFKDNLKVLHQAMMYLITDALVPERWERFFRKGEIISCLEQRTTTRSTIPRTTRKGGSSASTRLTPQSKTCKDTKRSARPTPSSTSGGGKKKTASKT